MCCFSSKVSTLLSGNLEFPKCGCIRAAQGEQSVAPSIAMGSFLPHSPASACESESFLTHQFYLRIPIKKIISWRTTTTTKCSLKRSSGKDPLQQGARIKLTGTHQKNKRPKTQRQMSCPQLTPVQQGTAGYGRPSHTVHSCSLHAALLCKYERSTAELSSFSLSSLNFRGFTDRPLAALQALWMENLSFLSWIKTKRKSPTKPSLDVWKKLIDQIHINTDKMCVFFKM